ncbi:MAG: enoyl-CoA hydratase/isomerase family protein [Sphingomonadales bacterium]|nr:enoyl-CoA hydratase/isomerase family protein [Sphingomonadales bacterium]
MSDAVVLAERDGAVLLLTLNRPERGNAWNGAMSRACFAALEDAARDPAVRAIVVTGAGNAFCTGGDGEKLAEVAEAGTAQSTAPLPFWTPLRIGKPVIGAINGACFGIGLQQALCYDVRFASEEAKFATAYTRRGLVAEFGMSWLLPRLVGTGHAMDLLLSARLVRAAEALAMGLVNRVVPADRLLDEAMAYARTLAAQCSPWAMRAVKQQVWHDLTARYAESHARSEALLAEATAGPDFREGIASWQEQRAPAFPALDEALGFIEIRSRFHSD